MRSDRVAFPGASAESSLAQIQASLAETAQGFGVPAGYD